MRLAGDEGVPKFNQGARLVWRSAVGHRGFKTHSMPASDRVGPDDGYGVEDSDGRDRLE